MDRNRKNPLPAAARPDPVSAERHGAASSAASASAASGAPGRPPPTLAFSTTEAPSIGLPKGGGALRGIGEKFQVNPATGTGAMAVPLPLSPSRLGGLVPSLSLSYDSGAGNSVFGLGWNVGIPSIQRKTEKRIPTYADDSDVFVLAGVEDLVPDPAGPTTEGDFTVLRYRPRVEGGFLRIERSKHTSSGVAHFRVVTPDNVTHIYGDTPETRIAGPEIADPDRRARVFAWLLHTSKDDRGNVVTYEYVAEDLANVPTASPHEAPRHSGKALFANKHPKRITYANTEPGDGEARRVEVVFDYGEHDADMPTPAAAQGVTWPVRQDPFSSGRAGFEMRTYRLCRRVLVFHHFSELGQTPALVRSLDLTHQSDASLTRLVSVKQRGYIRQPNGTYESQSTPETEFGYSILTLDFTVRALDPGVLADVSPETLATAAQWIDLDGEGLSGLLFEQGGALHYKRNRGDGVLAPAKRLETHPSLTMLGQGLLEVRDVGGTGEQAMVALTRPVAGFFARSEDGGWEPFRPFLHQPNVDIEDRNVRFLDLNGDGIADLVVARGDSFLWYPSRGKEGFDPPRAFPRPTDEARSPVCVFSDGTGTLFLADMIGDGLADFVRVEAGRVSYWPNLGHGRFGAEIVMSNSPRLAGKEPFEPGRVRLADLDGTGPADLVYADAGGLRVFFNQAGNGWSDANEIPAFPSAAARGTFSIADLFGTGTACIVWRNMVSSRPDEPLRYIDLLEGKKPHLLVSADNHLGLETRISHAPSTKFYLADLAAGRPWATRLPFVVHVIEKAEHYDSISKTRTVTEYAYHHGCYDTDEREFRGFGMVEQRDTESVADSWGQGLFTDKPPPQNGECLRPPVLTKTWLHPGVIRGRKRIEDAYSAEYYGWDPEDPDPCLLPDTELPGGLTPSERRQAYRAMKGLTLRTEVYALDGSPKEARPYTVTEHAYTLRKEQDEVSVPSGVVHPAVFLVHGREVVEAAYERNQNNPRISHQLTLDVDARGHVTRGATIAYGRASGQNVAEEQTKTWVIFAEHAFAAPIDDGDGFRHGVPTESRLYELHGSDAPQGGTILSFGDLHEDVTSATPIAYEAALSGDLEKRLIGHVKHKYYDSTTLLSALGFGLSDVLALPYESYSLAFTPGLLGDLDGRFTDAMLTEGGYVELTTGHWWIPSGRSLLDAGHFYRPAGVTDPFGNTTSITYDVYSLFATSVTDAIGNTVEAELDYRVLAPSLVTDPNGNRGAAAFDALGRVTATAVMGKVGGSDGDTLEDPTARFTYVLDAWDTGEKPNHVKTEARETHGDSETRWQTSYAYFDGFGRACLTKAQAEPGLAPERDSAGQLVYDNEGHLVYTQAEDRWVGNGRTVFDNKGQPVKQYEPYFSSTPAFEDETDLVQQGVTPILRYDPLGRLIRTDLPNGSYSRVEFDAWSQSASDPNDTTAESGNAWTEARLPTATPAPSDEEQRAAERALDHANTPATSHVDALGRVFLVQARLTPTSLVETGTTFDVEGQALSITDALGRECAQNMYSVDGQVVRASHIDSGQRFALSDVMGAPLYAWDALGHRVRTQLDALRRPTHIWVKKGMDDEWLSQRMVYGEAVTNPETINLRGKLLYHFDGAGLTVANSFDFKGNLLSSSRRLAVTYDAEPDWSDLAAITDPEDVLDGADTLLESEAFAKSMAYDALNRPVSMTQPDSSEILPSYNEAGLLDGVEVKIRGASTATTFVENINYDAKGRREKITYGNDTETQYTYDPLTYRVTRTKTTRDSDSAVLQNLHCTYDPVGNIVAIADTAHQTVFFDNQVVEPSALYEYDALYRLVSATGREHAGGIGDDQRDHSGLPLHNLPHANDAQALRNYEEAYEYDLVGNILEMIHTAVNSSAGSWTRRYAYGADPFPTPPEQPPEVPENNRLHSTSLPGDAATGPYTATYDHDANGNMVSMPHLASIAHTHKNQMREADLGGGGTAYYTYDASGERVRKVIQRIGTTREERIYLDGWELYRKRQGVNQGMVLERETLHIMDDTRRIAMVETKTVDADVQGTLAIVSRIRYQLDNHLGTAALEVDDTGLVISYEEYHPYGNSAYRSARSGIQVSEKRYRYTGKERDDETGFNYHSARYYAPWLARWTNADPKGMVDGPNLYAYVSGAPIDLIDPTGTDEKAPPCQPAPAPGVWRTDVAPPPGNPTGAPNLSTLDSPAMLAGKEAGKKGEALGVKYGEYLAWVDALKGKLSKTYGDVSVLDNMTAVEKEELANKFLDKAKTLPALPAALFSDPTLGASAVAGFERGVKGKYAEDMTALSVVNFAVEVAKLVLPVAISLLSSLGRKVVVDLFGGRASQVKGAINVDIAAEDGIRADVMKGIPLKSSIVDEILVTNPYIPGAATGSKAANTWLSEAARVLKPGGRMIVTGNLAGNKFAKLPSEEELKKLGLKLVGEPGPVTDARLLAQTMHRINGEVLRVETLQSYVLEKLK